MNDNFRNLLKQLDLLDKSDIYNGDLIEIEADSANHSWLFNVEFDHPISIEDFELFHEKIVELPKKIKSVSKTEMVVSYKENDYKMLPEYYDFVLKFL